MVWAPHSFRAVGLLGALVLGVSCSSPNVNPPVAKARKGYIDFYAPAKTNLAWEVQRVRPGTDSASTIFSSVKPLPDGVLRLELDPGPHLFQLSFLNRVVESPLLVQVDVLAGKVTPVKVELVPIESISVTRKQESVGMNVRGAGRTTRYSTQPGATERIMASVQPPALYHPKQQTIYPP